LTPAQIVAELDRYIVGQDRAKRAVAIALRNRWRRQKLAPEMRDRVRVSVQRPSRVGAVASVSVSIRHPVGLPFPSSVAVDLVAKATMRTER